MRNKIICFKTAFEAVRFLQTGPGHDRLWITRFYAGIGNERYYYAIVDAEHRVLADWNSQTHRWEARADAWTVVQDGRDWLPDDVLAECLSQEQLFQLSLVEYFA